MKKHTMQAKKQRELDALAEKAALAEACKPHPGRPYYTSFDEYVADYPEGERFRAWLTSNGTKEVTLLAMDRPDLHNSLPGSYLAATVCTWSTSPSKSPVSSTVQLAVRDSDDGLFVKQWISCDTDPAMAILSQMKTLAPFTARDCVDVFGLKPE